jgi:hypothetical protein
MIFIIFTVGGIFLFLVMVIAGWKIACWFWRVVLGIPRYPPVAESAALELPPYLDDRITPSE